MGRGPPTPRRRAWFAVWALLAAALLCTESSGSDGLKPPAQHPRWLGRRVGVAWGGNALDMLENPAGIAWVRRHQLQVSGNWLSIDAEYADPRNPSDRSSHSQDFPYPSFGLVFDPDTFFSGVERPPLFAEPAFPSASSRGSPILRVFGARRSVHIPARHFPRVVEVTAARHYETVSALVRDVTVTAHYGGHHTVVATSTGHGVVLPVEAVVARLEGFVNPLPYEPDGLTVGFVVDATLVSDYAGVDLGVRIDGVPAGGAAVTSLDAMPTGPPAPPAPQVVEREPSNVRVGIGFFVQSGAGSDTTINTILYPEGVPHKSNFSLVTLTPTIAWDLDEWGAFGMSLHLNYGTMQLRTPVTQSPDILQGPVFPTGSLQGAFGTAFGIPTQFGPAMAYVFDTSAAHAAGDSITHTAKPNDSLFSRVQGTGRLRELESFGIGGRVGYIVRLTDWLRFGASYQLPTYMGDYVGRAQIDFNRQIQAYRATTTVGHTDEVSIVGVPTELRFTFTQIFDPPGTADVFTFGALTIPGFPVPGGSIMANLPNGGAGGFAGEYDARVKDFTLPPELSLGFAVDVTDWLTVGFDWKHTFWSQAMEEFVVELTNGTNPDVNALVGDDKLTVRLPLEWEDQDLFALGLEVRPFRSLTLRAGGSWANNPIPADTVQPLLPATSEYSLGGGFSLQVSPDTSVDFAVLWSLPTRVHVDSSEIAPDLEGATYRVEHLLYMGGLTVDW